MESIRNGDDGKKGKAEKDEAKLTWVSSLDDQDNAETTGKKEYSPW